MKTITRSLVLILTLAAIVFLAEPLTAQTTLPTTTLSAGLSGQPNSAQTNVTIASVGSGATQLRVGYLLYADWEAMRVVSCGTVTAANSVCSSTSLVVLRGAAGTRSAPHLSGATVTYGPASSDGLTGGFQAGPPPIGQCVRANYLYLPWIDLTTGNQWTCDQRESGVATLKWYGANLAVLAYNSTINVGVGE